MTGRRENRTKALPGAIRLLGAAGFLLGTLGAGMAEADCDTFYRVKRGDTLRSISTQNLGHEDYQQVFHANRDILRSPSRLETGQLLYLPCAGEAAERSDVIASRGIGITLRDEIGDHAARRQLRERFDGEAPGFRRAPGAVVGPTARIPGDLTLLTGSGLAPLAGEELPAGGLTSLLIRRALAAGGGGRTPAEVAFIDDWKSHLPVLMPTGSFDLGFPWPRPDCTRPEAGAISARLCRDYLFSRAIYEIQVDALVRPDDPLATASSLDVLAGRTICRPLDFPPVDLEALGIEMTIIADRTAKECARLVAAGKADVVSLPTTRAEALLHEQEFQGALRRAAHLGRSVPVHALAWRATPHAEALIRRLDAGLEELQNTGEWYRIVSAYIGDYVASAATQ